MLLTLSRRSIEIALAVEEKIEQFYISRFPILRGKYREVIVRGGLI